MKRLDAYWYSTNPVALLLAPVAWLYRLTVAVRRAAYRLGLLRVHHLTVPVIVIGNISVGGTGKTPLVIWLAQYLAEAGYAPGVVSRGYGGKARYWPQQVRADGDPSVVGDEALLIARRCGCPMAVGPNRAEAARALVEHAHCNVVIADDGLQHYALARDVEINVVDGVRRFGNGRCLPAGPLREPRSRLRRVDFVVVNGVAGHGSFAMRLIDDRPRNLIDEKRRLEWETLRGQSVHAVAGIGYPDRFFAALRRRGLHPIEHPFPDHHPFCAEDLDFGDDRPILMTEKDAVKCQHFARSECWYVPITAEPDPRLGPRVLELLERKRSNG